MNPKSSDPRPPVTGNEGHGSLIQSTAFVAPVNAAIVADMDAFCRELDLLLPGIQLAMASMANRLNGGSEQEEVIRVKRESETIAGLLTSFILKGEDAFGRLLPYLEAGISDREVQQQ